MDAPPDAPPLRLAVLGFGSVGRSLARLLLGLQERLAAERGFRWVITAIASATRGAWIDPAGLPLRSALTHCEKGAPGWPTEQVRELGTPEQLLTEVSADVLIEATPLDPMSGEPARSYLAAALKQGMHVVTCNKGPIAHAYTELRALAALSGVQLRFESTVMDGAPVFLLAERALPMTHIVGVRGTLNSTSNYVTSAMEMGRTAGEAIREAQLAGVAEADPTFDLEGWDSVAKLCVLANVLMGAHMTPAMVTPPGWPPPSAGSGTYRRQVARAWIDTRGRVVGTVTWEQLQPNDPLATTQFSTALTLTTDTLKDITLVIDNPDTNQTAYGVLADLLTVAGIAYRH